MVLRATPSTTAGHAWFLFAICKCGCDGAGSRDTRPSDVPKCCEKLFPRNPADFPVCTSQPDASKEAEGFARLREGQRRLTEWKPSAGTPGAGRRPRPPTGHGASLATHSLAHRRTNKPQRGGGCDPNQLHLHVPDSSSRFWFPAVTCEPPHGPQPTYQSLLGGDDHLGSSKCGHKRFRPGSMTGDGNLGLAVAVTPWLRHRCQAASGAKDDPQ